MCSKYDVYASYDWIILSSYTHLKLSIPGHFLVIFTLFLTRAAFSIWFYTVNKNLPSFPIPVPVVYGSKEVAINVLHFTILYRYTNLYPLLRLILEILLIRQLSRLKDML